MPKRDGVQGRYYLIQKPDMHPEVLEHADQCIQDMVDGTAKENHSDYSVVVRNQSGTTFLPSQPLDWYLSKLPLKGFNYEEAVIFCDALRWLAGWSEILSDDFAQLFTAQGHGAKNHSQKRQLDHSGVGIYADEDEQTIKTIGVRVATQGDYAVRQTFDGAVWIGSKDYREASWKDFAGLAIPSN